jgi:hypothetical protein
VPALLPLFSPARLGEIAQLSAIFDRAGPPDALVWPRARELPGYMQGDSACRFCSDAQRRGEASLPPLRWQDELPWLRAETLRDSCCGGAAPPLFHLHAALGLARWVGCGAGGTATLAPGDALALDLALRLLAFDPERRLGAQEALHHAWLCGDNEGKGEEEEEEEEEGLRAFFREVGAAAERAREAAAAKAAESD